MSILSLATLQGAKVENCPKCRQRSDAIFVSSRFSGELRDRTFASQFYRAAWLNLLINAIVYWNTLYLETAFAELNREGIVTPPDVIKHIAPLGWPHISLTGDYI
jgi:hypothetical protein